MLDWTDEYPEESEGWWYEDRRVEEVHELLSNRSSMEVFDLYRTLTIVGDLQPFFGPQLLFHLAFAKLKETHPEVYREVLMLGAREDHRAIHEICIKALHDILLTEANPEIEQLMIRLLSHQYHYVHEGAIRSLNVTLHRVPRPFERVLELTRQMQLAAASFERLY